MMTKQYPVALEVSGPLAIFARPDTGGTPTSYPAPTWSAAKGLFESIAFLADAAAWICPTKVEVCRRVGEPGGRVCFQKYTTNYGGPMREAGLRNAGIVLGGSAMQFFATVLSNVCYRLHGIVIGPDRRGATNAKHFLKDLFERRLRQGRCFRTPCLGWSEFTCSYWGPYRCTRLSGANESSEENTAWKDHCVRWNIPFRDETVVDDAFSLDVPSMLLAMWDKPVTVRGETVSYAPRFAQAAPGGAGDEPSLTIRNGTLTYKIPTEWYGRSNEKEVNRAQ
jgi:CRISPR-associated protein Cas5d